MPQHDDNSIVILTGAGISKESGLDTFRDADGIWAKVRLEDVATPEAFARDPAGPHARAIRAVREDGWFREELYARFHIAGDLGTWGSAS